MKLAYADVNRAANKILDKHIRISALMRMSALKRISALK